MTADEQAARPAARRRGFSRLPMFARTADQVEAYAQAWQTANLDQFAATGPLWVVLGDSAAQAVGATPETGYVGQLRRLLETADGQQWRVVNLSRSGARTAEVLASQLPQLAALEQRPNLVSAVIGGNDVLHTRTRRWLADIDALFAALPPGAVVATVARGLFERKARPVNDHIRSAAAERRLRLADLWRHTGPPYRGLYADGLHPNERGYAQWTAALAEALGLARSPGNVTGP